jgi:hypothetical protein
MHVLIPYAISDEDAARAALQGVALPQLQNLLGRMNRQTVVQLPEHHALSADEILQARAQGLNDKAPQWAALRAHALGLPGATTEVWGFVTPVHWELGQARVSLRDPAELDLSADEARTLMYAMRPFFAEDGLTLHEDTPQRWLVSGEPLRGLICARPERVIGRDVAPWLPSAPLLRRLQNEMQMLLYTHPSTDEREARRALTVNSFWLSSTGALDALPEPTQTITVLNGLATPAVRGDWRAWAQAWQALDAELAPLRSALDAGEPMTLTLCHELSARRYTPSAESWWGRLRRRWQGTQLTDHLVIG